MPPTTQAPPQVGVALPTPNPANRDDPQPSTEAQPLSLSSFWLQMAQSKRYDGGDLIEAAFTAGDRAVRALADELGKAPTSENDVA